MCQQSVLRSKACGLQRWSNGTVWLQCYGVTGSKTCIVQHAAHKQVGCLKCWPQCTVWLHYGSVTVNTMLTVSVHAQLVVIVHTYSSQAGMDLQCWPYCAAWLQHGGQSMTMSMYALQCWLAPLHGLAAPMHCYINSHDVSVSHCLAAALQCCSHGTCRSISDGTCRSISESAETTMHGALKTARGNNLNFERMLLDGQVQL